ncbi:ribosomal protein L35 [Tolypothrix tenuis PCC 7101]|uniref:Large ribosomal subunit protein bL35 n=2 Tax=Tolypothrichaceae TaxID=119859 RepID=A0A1Z4MUC5_9CYAN|nr:ribosomal protein L35 [Tolypothrix sp. PCC 7601]BAY93367.1 ribosomal protein L35 [Microchaete diplosiphon NIES-3275]BAY97082.1 ribosomal protein L35 [Tolypothrix tenuis PCC 7101]BAZ72410.1 ribosomal protein L35 [Aulosira laxa NIES-50]
MIDCVDQSQTMPKLKTRKAAAKRFRATGTGKIVRRKAYKNHLLEHKTSDKKRSMSKSGLVHERDEDNVRLMLPYL